jgi:hypothetical protein
MAADGINREEKGREKGAEGKGGGDYFFLKLEITLWEGNKSSRYFFSVRAHEVPARLPGRQGWWSLPVSNFGSNYRME